MYPPELCFSTGAENMQPYKPSPTHDIIPPDSCQSFHPPPNFSLYNAGAADTLRTISILQTHTHSMPAQSADHSRFNIQGRGWDAGGGFWDTSNTSGETKNTHTQGSEDDLPPRINKQHAKIIRHVMKGAASENRKTDH